MGPTFIYLAVSSLFECVNLVLIQISGSYRWVLTVLFFLSPPRLIFQPQIEYMVRIQQQQQLDDDFHLLLGNGRGLARRVSTF